VKQAQRFGIGYGLHDFSNLPLFRRHTRARRRHHGKYPGLLTERLTSLRRGYSAAMADDLTQIRIAQNQSAFREANERIESAADAMGLWQHLPFICECPVESCTELVRMSIDEYESIREVPTWFLTAPGHEAVSVGAGAAVVLERRAEYVLVEKIGAAAEVAEEEYQRLSDSAA
jgi:hypothetical protein